MRGGQAAININRDIGPFFRNKCGVRQGDPISPLFFNVLADALAQMLDRAKEVGHISGVAANIIEGGLSQIQYADDTLIFIKNSEREFINLKFLLMCSEEMSGLKINFEKSEAFVTGGDLESQLRTAHMMNCELGTIPMKYLGMPISSRALTMGDFDPIVENVAGRVEPWQGKLLASGGRLVLINDCHTNMPMFVMVFYLLKDGTHAAFNKVRSRFFWAKEQGRQKYHMVKWEHICSPKEVGGLGVINTKVMNWCLMAKWAWKILRGQGGLWLSVFSNKYLLD